MNLKILMCLTLLFTLITSGYSQNKVNQSNPFGKQELKNKLLSGESKEEKLKIAETEKSSGKSPALALLFSVILPGSGHYYLGRMDVGKYFLGADALSWMGLASLNIYGDALRDDARTYSVEHAGVKDKDSKDNDFYTNIGSFANVYEYNNEKLLRGEYYLLYNTNTYFWNWDNSDNQSIYETQRKSSERVYNTRVVFGSLLIANRIVSGISAYLIATSKDGKSSSVNFQPELLYSKDFNFDGVKLNISKNF